jgi:hypothetical protein
MVRHWLLAVVAVFILAGGTAHVRAVSPQPPRTDVTSIAVLEPLVDATAKPGNAGRDFAAITTLVGSRTLAIVRERFPAAELLDAQGMGQGLDLARQHGATHLLVPVITEWRQMRTDDPIGALILPHNRITIELRLLRVYPTAPVRGATFHNSAHITVNQPAARLLDAKFRRILLGLLSAP